MRKKMRFAIVGAGAIGAVYAQALEKSKDGKLVAIADVLPGAAARLSALHRCDAYATVEAMVAGSDIESAIVCTPPKTHAAIANFLTAHGIHTLCEKPLSLTIEDARSMVESAKSSGVKLTMGSKFRYVDDVVRAKAMVASGLIGELILFENSFTSRVPMLARWNSNPDLSGGGVLIDNGTHSVDIMRYFLGALEWVQAVEGKRVQDLVVEDTVRLFVRSCEGVMGSIDLSWSIQKTTTNYIEIYGSAGTITVGWNGSRYRTDSSGDWISFGSGYDKTRAFCAQIENFCAAIRHQEPLRITPEDALASVEVIESAYRALRRNGWTSVHAAPVLPELAVAAI
ncbi:MAG: Gfo/Idh/MocA family oxidoreductase [Candidatus Eremiobacteraeota bacterium]|nr:Gfo/Idh/MocA family oxidoreductase [Candidatus Eremiobacteraeota bacterium]MBV9737707.1 Gfo/Idh/MocA family oxidoreductase [Candidatus Eremiobacteraeota bacterium]